MNDLISRQTVIDEIKKISPDLFSAQQHHAYIDKQEVMLRLMAIPLVECGADVVEVVRCKDCVNCAHLVYKYDRNEEWWCGGLEVVPDGFCNYGERKEDNGKIC